MKGDKYKEYYYKNVDQRIRETMFYIYIF